MKQEFNSKNFSRKLRQKRIIEENIDMRTLSIKLDLSPATLSRVENGKTPDIVTYATLCKWMGESLDKFVKTKRG